jgi:branched-chain amino acid transport system permease protein
MLTALVGSVVFSLSLSAGPAWAEGEAVQGSLRNDDQPVAGVSISVTTADGAPVGTVQSAADGTWVVPVPAAGEYEVELDESTLPNGLRLRREPVLEVEVFAGQARTVLFALEGSADGPAPGRPTGTPSPGAEEEPGQIGGEGEEGTEDEEVDVVAGRGRFGTALALIYSGIHFGLYLALAALGLSLIFGTMGLVNFSHGELVTFGAVVAFLVNVSAGLPVLVAAVVAVALGGLFGWLQDLVFWGWLRRRGTGLIAMMIISIGVALMLRFGYLYFMGGQARRYTEFVVQDTFSVGPVSFVPKTLIADAVAIVVLVSVSLTLIYSRWGKATRAVADNPSLAAASGINVDRVIRMVWAVGGALAALSGVILAIDQGAVWQMGLRVLLLIFAAVVLGGLGTAFGAMVGSLIVGVFVQVSTLWIPSELKYAGALVVLIAALLLRPQGILGRRERVG